MAVTAKTNENDADAALKDMAEQIASLRNDLAGLTEALGNYGKAQGRTLGDKAARTAEQIRAEGQVQAERLNLQAAALQSQANDFIIRQPAMALGIAAGLGYIIGLWTSRR